MWEINNSTPYEVDRGWVRGIDGREVWLVAVRARFAIVPRSEAIWQPKLKQDMVKVAPEMMGSGISCQLTADTDLVHTKQATDVLMDGSAHAPRGHLATRINVRMKVGPIDKRITVFGNRVWKHGRASDPEPFSEMPLTYARAFGGPDLAEECENPTDWYEPNPAGVWYSTQSAALKGQPMPNIETPSALITAPSARPPPAGFAPIAPHWTQRRCYAGTYDEKWEKERLPLLPSDFNPRFHQQAPGDQQVDGYLRGGEVVLLEGVHPDGPLEFALPRVSLAFETEFDDSTEIVHDARLHTVVFEPDIPAVSLVWHTSLECHSRVNLLLQTRVWERARMRTAAQ